MTQTLLFLAGLLSSRALASAVLPVERCEYTYMTQRIDHFGQHNGTFQQRFAINTEYFKPGGPILFFQGEESDFLDCYNETILYEWAQELDGLLVNLEHRYFGPSKPFGNASSTIENLKLLTLDNVMADAVEFIAQLKANISGAEHSRTVAASGSYGGFLVSAFRQNHPQTFDIALAASVPVMGYGNSSDPESYGWYNWLNRLYLDHSVEASKNIKNAFTHLLDRLMKNDTASLQDELGLCTPVVPGNQTQVLAVRDLLLQVFSIGPEFNYPYPSPGRSPVALPFPDILNFAVNQTDPIQLLAKINWFWFEPLGAKCIDHEHSVDFIKNVAVPVINYEYFSFIGCTYNPMHSTGYTPINTIFPVRTANRTAADLACLTNYGTPTLTKAEIESRYHLSPADLQNSTHII